MRAAGAAPPDPRRASLRAAAANETLAEARARNVRDALREDVGTGDWTARLVPSGPATARVRVREEAVLCGRDWFEACVRALDPAAAIEWRYDEGADMAADTTVCEVRGDARALLTAERPALNFLQLLSGTATVTRRHVRAIEGASPNPRGCVVLDTRKTVPGLRLAQKYAVRVGGGSNQRLALWDGILIKENHVAAAGGITAAISERARPRCRRRGPGRGRDARPARRGASRPAPPASCSTTSRSSACARRSP